MKRSPLLSVAMPPHTHLGISVTEIHLHHLLALLPAAVGGILLWGLPGLRTLLLAVGATVAFEWLTGRMMKRETSLLDLSAVVQGLMLGFLLHAASPWWLVLLGAVLLVVLGKQFFGGQGGYLLQPVLLAYAVLLISWPQQLNAVWRLAGFITPAQPIDPLLAWKSFGPAAAEVFPLGDLLLGLQTGGVAAGMVGLLALGGLYLIVRGFIAWRIPLGFLGMAFVTALAFHLADPATYAPPGLHLASGILVFAAFFLATDFSCAPVNPWAQVVYGAACGLLAILIRTFGVYPDGTVFAVLLMNLAQPLIDKIRPPVIGVEVASR